MFRTCSQQYPSTLGSASVGWPRGFLLQTLTERRAYSACKTGRAEGQGNAESSTLRKAEPSTYLLQESQNDRSRPLARPMHSWSSLPNCQTDRTKWKSTASEAGMRTVNPEPENPSQSQLKSELRRLLRHVAQPVAVVTSFMPHQPRKDSLGYRLHGATLSSFSSIAMDPHPLIAFALRVPSRMATTLSSLVPTVFPSPPPKPGPPLSPTVDPSHAHLVVNILSSSQHRLAHVFSRPDLYPDPFQDVQHTLSTDGLPILDETLCAFSCKVISKVKLSELDCGEEHTSVENSHRDGEVTSELFIARVVRVEQVGEDLEGGPHPPKPAPLLYYRRGYTFARPPEHHY
ncbi:hypothetical protein NMY22_g13043 [Coprinellus aureogranulatus]|nr:hypothetical protein NMY22_g13043 [Coprinellus aureogranulatus]